MATTNEVKENNVHRFGYCGGLSRILVMVLALLTVLAAIPLSAFADAYITSISRNSGAPGSENLSVTVTGNSTNWVNQVTTASFGPGISVGGGAVGQPGPVAVTSANALTATIMIGTQAAVGPRNVIIQTGSQLETVQDGFTVLTCGTTPPSWITNTPQQNASNVPLNPFIQIKFDSPLDRTTVNATDFIVRDNVTGMNIPANVSVDASGRIISLTPSQSLAVNRQHLVGWGNFGGNAQIKDTCGNVLPNKTYNFTTGLAEDRTVPSLIVNNPVNGATNIPQNVSIGLQFSEPINPISVATGLVVTTGNNTVPGSFNFSNDYSRITFVPTSTLLPNSIYSVTCTSQLQDLAGNSLLNPGSFSFTTGSSTDVAQGTITGANPNGLSGVGTNVTPTVYFSERVNPLTLTASNFYLYDYNTDKTIPTTISVAADQMSATLIPSQALQPNTTFRFYCYSPYDIAGNAFSGSSQWSFTTGSGSITTAPSVSMISPPNGANGTPVNTQVVAMMSAQINKNTVGQGSITVTPQGSSTPVAGTVTLASDQVTLTWAPTALLATSTTYNVAVGGFYDPQGNAVAPFTSSFTTGTSSAAVTGSFSVSSVTPANGSTITDNTTPIVITFSRAINPATMSKILVQTSTGYNIAGTWVINPNNGAQATFTPTTSYPGTVTIYVYLQYAVKDLAGNTNSSNQATQFTTANVADLTAPTVTSVTPANNATGVGRNATIVLTFSESVNPSTVTSTSVQVFAGATSIGASGISISADNRTVSFTPTAPAGETITIVATSDIKDLSGNSLVNFQSRYQTASDAPPLTVTSVTPLNSATGIRRNVKIIFTFSNSLNPGTVNPDTIQVLSGGVKLPVTPTISSDNRTVTLSPYLPPSTEITVIANTGIQDVTGNSLANFQSKFTTAADISSNAPQVVTMRPGNGATNVAPNSVITLFSSGNPLNPATVQNALHIAQNGILVAGTVQLGGNNQTIEFTPSTPFAYGAVIQAFLDATVQDIYGNVLQAFSGQFTVQGNPASAAPRLVAANPYNGATNVALNVIPQFAFDQPLATATVNATSVRLYDNCTTQAVPGTVSLVSGGDVAGGNNVVQFQPQGPLTATCNGNARTYRYQMNVFGGTATGANGMSAPGVNYSFTVGNSSDTTNPSVVSVAPPNGSTGVGINGIVVVTFNKPINPISVTGSTVRIINGSQTVVPSSISFDSTGAIVTITPQAPLPGSSQIAFAINGVSDLEGNLVDPFASQFTTSAGTDITKPTILAVTPLSGAAISRNTAAFVVQFSEPMDRISINNNTFSLFDSTTNLNIPGTITASADLTTYSFAPGYATNGSGALTAGDSIYLKVNGAQDLAGNGPDASTSYYTVSSGQTALEPSITGFDPINAVVGTHVAISGSNFDYIAANNTVKFNGVVATVISATETQLIAIVPTGATTGPITVSTHVGTATTASQFIVGTRDTVAPTTTIITPAPNLTLSGDYFTITGMVTDVGYGAALVELSLDNGASWQEVWHSWYGSNSWSYNWTLPTTGTFTLKARGTDVSGNVGSDSTVTVTVANGAFTAPTINPIPAVVPATSVTIIGSKLPRALQMQISCGAAVVENLTITSATTWKATLSGLAQGQNTVTAFGIDSTGTTSATASMTFSVDTLPPAPATLFSATTVTTGVKLDWTHSSSTDMREYRLYWDNGNGTISYATPAAVVSYPTNSYTMAVPQEGTYRFGLRAVDTAGNEDKNTNLIATATINGYSVAVSVTGDVHKRGEDVQITGSVLAGDSTPLVNVPVTMEVESRGYIRTYTAYTKATGAFSYTFQPMANEAGSYTVKAKVLHQGLAKSATSTFSIIGMLVEPSQVTVDMSMNSPKTVNINLRNIGASTATDLQYALVDIDLGDSIHGFLDTASLPTSLAAGASVVIPVLINADPGTPPAAPVVFTLTVTATDGTRETATIAARLHEAASLPVVTPDPIMSGVKIGSPVTKPISITNQGYATMTGTSLKVHDPAFYPWVTVLNDTIGDIGPQQEASCQLFINPTSDITLGTYVIQLDLSYNGTTRAVYLTAEVTTATVGQVAFKVHDDTGSVVSGAEVNLISKAFYVNVTPNGRQEYNNVIKGTTNQQGYILFSDVPAGDYRYVVNAVRHDQKDGPITVEPGSTPQTIGVIMVTNLVNVDFSVTQTTIQDQYTVNLNITYVTDLIKPTLYVTPYRVDLSFFPEETFQGAFTITNTSNNAAVRDLTLDATDLNQGDNEIRIVFDDGTVDGTQKIPLGELGFGKSIQVPYKAIIYGTNPKLNNRNLGNIIATAKYTFSIDGQANESTTTTPIPVLYWKPQDFALPSISYVNDETDGNLCDLEYQGTTYRMIVKSNRNMGVTLDSSLKAVNQVNGGPDPSSIIDSNSSLWTGSFTPTVLSVKGDMATFDIDDLKVNLENKLCIDRNNFLGKPNFVGFKGKWTDRTTKDAYLIPISIITKRIEGIYIVGPSPDSGSGSGGGWVGGYHPDFQRTRYSQDTDRPEGFSGARGVQCQAQYKTVCDTARQLQAKSQHQG